MSLIISLPLASPIAWPLAHHPASICKHSLACRQFSLLPFCQLVQLRFQQEGIAVNASILNVIAWEQPRRGRDRRTSALLGDLPNGLPIYYSVVGLHPSAIPFQQIASKGLILHLLVGVRFCLYIAEMSVPHNLLRSPYIFLCSRN